MLLQLDLNKRRLSQLYKLDKLYTKSELTRLLQISKIKFIELEIQMFPNNSHINLRACDDASSYHFLPPITVLKNPKWICTFNCCSDCPRINYTYL